MTGDDLHVCGNLCQNFFDAIDHAVDTASAVDVDEGESVGDEVVAHVHDVGFGKEDDGVAVGVAGREVQGTDIFAIQVNGDVVIERDDWQGSFGSGLEIHMDRTAVSCAAAGLEALADVVMCDDRRLFLEVFVSAGVIPVIVRVDDEADGLVGDALQRGLNLIGQWSVLIVDDHDTVLADGGADVSASALEHVDVSRDFRDFDLNLAEVFVLRGRTDGGDEQCGEKKREFAHARPSGFVWDTGSILHRADADGERSVQVKIDFDRDRYRHRLTTLLRGFEFPFADGLYCLFVQAQAYW